MKEINFNVEDIEKIDLSMDVGIKEIYPPLENLEVVPTKQKQIFKHENSYGYDNVTIDPISDEYIIPSGTLPITENTTYDVREYAKVSASVHPAPNLQDKEVTPTKETQNITSDENYDGLNEVIINAIPDEYIVPTGTLEITTNGIHNVKDYENINANIIAVPTLEEKNITPTKEVQTVIASEGYDGLSQVTVNPIPSEYIVPSGELEITESGTYDVTEYASANVNVTSGGGSGTSEEPTGTGVHVVKIVDYDGTLLLNQRFEDGAILTLPDFPEHEKLIGETWSCPVEIVNNTVTVDRDLIIGAIYNTKSGGTELDIVLTEDTGLSVTFYNMGTVSKVDWGDGVIQEKVALNTSTTHTYEQYGKYTITIYGLTRIQGYIFYGMKTGTSDGNNASENLILEEARLSNGITYISNTPISGSGNKRGFAYNYNLKAISLPNTLTDIRNYCFYEDINLKALIIPPSITSLNTYSISGYMPSRKYLVIPKATITYANTTRLQYDYSSLETLILPEGDTYIPGISNAYNLKKIVGASTITELPVALTWNSACRNFKTLDLSMCTSVPTLTTTAKLFDNRRPDFRVIVPDALYDEWIAATNWSTGAKYIIKKSDYINAEQ